jgi:hypothetical protein
MNDMNPAVPWRALLQTATDARASFETTITADEWGAMPPQRADRELDFLPQTALSAEQCEQAEESFELFTAIEALETLAHRIELVVAQRMEQAYAEALHIYYVTEELSRDPAHAALLPFLEAMRGAHEQQYGYAIPERRTH